MLSKQGKVGIIAVLVIALTSYGFGRYVQPAQIKEVIKTVEIVKHDTTTIVKEHKNRDGSSDTETTVVNHDIDLSKSDDSKTITNLTPQWKVQGQYGYNFQSLRPVYGAAIERRIVGPLFIGAWGNTDHTVGLSVGLEF